MFFMEILILVMGSRKWFLMQSQSPYCTPKWQRRTFLLKEVSFPLFDWCLYFFFPSFQCGNYVILCLAEFYYICHVHGCVNANFYVWGRNWITRLFGIHYFLKMVLIDDNDFFSFGLVGNVSKKVMVSYQKLVFPKIISFY